jgi:photosystem II stability/assembly factor-like uncharacterized protein
LKKIYHLVIILICITIFGCSENDNSISTFSPPPDLYWIPSGLDSNIVLSFYRTPPGDFLAGTNYGLFVSPDSGTTWNLNHNISSAAVTSFITYKDSGILAGTSGGGVYISYDNGENWSGAGLQGIVITALAVDPGGKIFAATRGRGIYAADSIGSSWIIVDPSFNASTFSSLLITTDNIIFAGGTGVYRSGDNGLSWILKNNGLGNWSVQSLIEDKAGFIDAGTDNGGFFRTGNNGESWTKLNNGLTNTEITTLALNSSGHIFAGTWGGGIFRSIDYGLNWTEADSGLSIKMVQKIYCYEDLLYAGTFKGIFRTLRRTVN